LKLNLGCGYRKVSGYVNVDNDPLCEPDIVADLETKLPWDDNSIDEIFLDHVLEHIGQDTRTYFNIWQEFYRILRDEAVIMISVPHYNHDHFHHDPTHVRVVTPIGIDMFNQRNNYETIKAGGSQSALGLKLGIDIAVTEVSYDLEPWYKQHMKNTKQTTFDLDEMSRYNNACYQIRIKAKAYKPARSQR
jgi:predicted SAM-dependent methyltransferase